MTFLEWAGRIIPGYASLPEKRREAFEGSVPGRQFSAFIRNTMEQSEVQKKSVGLLSWLWRDSNSEKQAFETNFILEKTAFIDGIKATNAYQTVIKGTKYQLFKEAFPEFRLLSTTQRKNLLKAESSKALLTELIRINQLILCESNDKQIERLKGRRLEQVNRWKTDPLLAPFMTAINERQQIRKRTQLEKHATQLARFVPLLHYRKLETEERAIDQLRAKYVLPNGEVNEEFNRIDEEELTTLFSHCMQEVSRLNIDFVNLVAFNNIHANQMAKAVLLAFNSNAALNLATWFRQYEAALNAHIIHQLQLINGEAWQASVHSIARELFNSLSYLWKNKTVGTLNTFLNKIADAHAFIQATHFSSQNESAYLAILDMYNIGRYREQIAEVKSIGASLLKPFRPLYEEYKNLGLYEKNGYRKAFRALMPIFITVAFIILVSYLLAPLALPALAFLAAFIPTLIIGLALATAYVSVKNGVYKYLREKWYGGPFEIPEFQVNERIRAAFGTEEKAQKVRQFFIEELKRCDIIEHNYEKKHKQGTLSDEEIEHRIEMQKMRQGLCLEWYDIHSNINLSIDEARLIVLNRLAQTSEKNYLNLTKMLDEERPAIGQSVQNVVADIQATFVDHHHLPVPGEDTTIRPHLTHGFFQPPKSLSQKFQIEEEVIIRLQLSF